MGPPSGEAYLLHRWILAASIAAALTPPLRGPARANDLRPARPTTGAAYAAPRRLWATEGRVLDVRRMSREITVRTPQGAVERIVIPQHAEIRAPQGGSGLSSIRRGMGLRVEGEADPRGRLVAQKIVAH